MKSFCLALLMALLSGCISDSYSKFYAPSLSHQYHHYLTQYPHDKQVNVEMRKVVNESDVLDIIEDGYIPVGVSSFEGIHCPYYFAIDCAKKNQCDLVLIDEQFKNTEEYTSIVLLPSVSTTYTHGNFRANTYGSKGSLSTYGNYSGSSTTTTMNATPVQMKRDIYFQNAAYYKKINFNDYYGAIFYVPPRLPTEKKDSPCNVKILAVLKNSRAEKDGLKRMDIVKAINGKEIVTRSDVNPFLNALSSITKVEVQ